MKRSYPFFFKFAGMGLAMAALGALLEIAIPDSETRRFGLLDVVVGMSTAVGVVIAFWTGVCGVANFLGSRKNSWKMDDLWPMRFIIAAAFAALGTVFSSIYIGDATSTWGQRVLFGGLALIVVCIFAAFYTRGMVPEGSEEWELARLKRTLARERRERQNS